MSSPGRGSRLGFLKGIAGKLDEAFLATLPRIVTTTAQTAGEYLETEFKLPAGGRGPPAHSHPASTEEWTVVSGALHVHLDGKPRELAQGETLVIPPGTVHRFANRSTVPAVVRDFHRPAGEFERFLRTEAAILRGGVARPSAVLRVALLWHSSRHMHRVAALPARWGMASLAAIARLLRLRLPEPEL
jgi:quercetin dioxygenase-like cupin family protein